MNKYSFSKKGVSFDLGINSVKFLLFNNYYYIQSFVNAMKQVFNRSGKTEYSNEFHLESQISIDDSSVDIRINDFYIINSNYDMSTELKLGSKSLITKYIEKIITQFEYSDEVKTLNLLLGDYSSIINERLLQTGLEKDSIKIETLELDIKAVIKLINAHLCIEGFRASEFDMDYSETVLFQLNMIQQIYEDDLTKRGIIFLELPYLTNQILDYICDEKRKNIHIFCTTREMNKYMNYQNTAIFNDEVTDLSIDVDLYNNILLNLPINISLEQLKNEMNEMFEGKNSASIEAIREAIF